MHWSLVLLMCALSGSFGFISAVICMAGRRTHRTPRKRSTYIRVGRQYKPDEILPLILPEGERAWGPKRIDLDGHLVNIRSDRLHTFKIDAACSCCGIKGVFFAKERHRVISSGSEQLFHLNLYALDHKGREIMMTSDHIIPRSRSKGMGLRNNRQTMCLRCNQAKGSRMISNAELAAELGVGGRK